MVGVMNSRRLALWAALAAATSWAAKSVAIGLAGGLDKSPLEAPLFFAGLISFVVAVVALGTAVTSAARTWMRVVAGLGAFAVGFSLTVVVDALVGTFHGSGAERHWVWTEFNLWVAALGALAVAITLNRSSTNRYASSATETGARWPSP
jgi:hypothetical protein